MVPRNLKGRLNQESGHEQDDSIGGVRGSPNMGRGRAAIDTKNRPQHGHVRFVCIISRQKEFSEFGLLASIEGDALMAANGVFTSSPTEANPLGLAEAAQDSGFTLV